MKRALVVGVFVILGTFVLSVVLNVWVTWTYVLPEFEGASTYLSPGLKFPLALLRSSLAEVPDRDPQKLSEQLGIEVRPMPDTERDALLARPALVVPLGQGETFHLWEDHEVGSRAVVRLADGRALSIGGFTKLTPLRPVTLTVWISIVVVLAVAASALIFLPLARRMRRLEDTARAWSAGDLTARAPTSGATRELGMALNLLASRTDRLIRSHEELLQAVSHELRTPAARIRFQMELLENEQDAAARERRTTAIDRDLDELDALVGELLSFSRLAADAPQWRREPLDVPAIARELASECETRCATQGEPVTVMAGARPFRRVLRNLVSNASKAAKSQVEIRWQRRGDVLEVMVDDDGPGVPKELRESVFKPFVVGESSRDKSKGQGIGLGLAIVQRIVELHGGSVRVEDAPLGGARFVTTWPV